MTPFRRHNASCAVAAALAVAACRPAPSPPPAATDIALIRAPAFLDRPELTAVLFHPSPQSQPDPRPGVAGITVTAEDGTRLAGRLHVAAAAAPLILWFYGNGEVAEQYDALAERFQRLGWSLLLFDYRGYGASPGQPSATSLLRDAITLGARLRRVLADHGVTPAKLVVVGRSLGSVPAIELAARSGDDLAGLVLDSAFTDTMRLVRTLGFEGSLAGRTETVDGFDNTARLRRVGAPLVVVHGELDEFVPIAEARELAATVPGSRFLSIAGAGHNDILRHGYESYVAVLRELIER